MEVKVQCVLTVMCVTVCLAAFIRASSADAICQPDEFCLGRRYRNTVQTCVCPDEVHELDGLLVAIPTKCQYDSRQRHFLCRPKVKYEGIDEHGRWISW
ncbi:uncharacterized protein LOC117301308 isoform X2 [Asterias rubens]|uniref:uncharacterized protein LOC117301308 isoform X2 n=1 Tax=Asterias rubens TaxID=7604 RepID=UPI0014557911|nr:uncharacterized protein LOC117301308 isoform X2 [Asterias rubens]